MCGILAFYKIKNIKGLEKTLFLLKHRGPDDFSTFFSKECTLGHTRLAIIDPENGRQPFFSTDKKITAVYNGEIYNFEEIKKDNNFNSLNSDSDGEIIIPLFKKYGLDFPKYLKGMFSIAIYDGEDLYVARDHLGIKPLYYCHGKDGICFSSEAKCLTRFHSQIEIFPPKTIWSSKHGFHSYMIKAWENKDYISKLEPDYSLIKSTFEKAVIKMLRSDVPIGVFLSGGLDSSLIAAIASANTKKFHTFAIGAPDSTDTYFARLVADHIKSTHHEINFSCEEAFSLYEKIIYHLETYDSAILYAAPAKYILSQYASKYIKVILSGQGADEAFGGYSHFEQEKNDEQRFQNELLEKINTLHFGILQSEDRMSMANSLEARVPFLDEDFLDLVMKIKPKMKFHTNDKIEKYILRHAFKGLLTKEILWRKKEPFGDALGKRWKQYLHKKVDILVTNDDLGNANKKFTDDPPKTKLGYYFRQIYEKHFPHKYMPKITKWTAWSP
ncbi:asparagine synthase B [Patescibacteria group bacterium]|nr:asparagine synthase B [Patescibacteria group bacterium]